MTDNAQVQPEPYAAAVRKLLKGVVYHVDDPKVWSQIRTYEFQLRQYFSQIGIELFLDDGMGFAFLKEGSRDDDGKSDLPALTIQRQLPFAVTLLLVLLRERLEDHLIRDVDGTELRLTYEDLSEMMLVFLADHPDARKMDQTVSSAVSRAVEHGFLKKLPDNHYAVRSVLRAKIAADTLDHIKSQLQEYIRQSHEENDDDERDEPV